MWALKRPGAGDGPRLRSLRLQALRTDGSAFLETLDEAAALNATAWEARVTRYTRRGHQVLVVAEEPGNLTWVGMAGAFLDSERDSDEFDLPDPPVGPGDRWAMVWGTYVVSQFRGQGVADGLCAALYTWACEEAGVDWLGLHVRDSNVAAIALYRRHGFGVVARNHHPELGVTSLVMVRAVNSARRISPKAMRSSRQPLPDEHFLH
ncbi:GNAT family N-acetyltransferase [Nocardia altamirensis]|uniref:GNAT family N-acetyltransferase n=1 Tax=Nocardia altamirensis TaxID=472158 RepID=UPI00084085DD|nr:N-acetyltransferase [Nocardia altamirensis]